MFDPVSNPPTVPQILDGLPDGVLAADAEGRVGSINRVAARMLGMRKRDALGRPLEEVLTLLDRRGSSWFEVNSPYQGLLIRSGVPEQAWTLPDGQEVLVKAKIHRSGRSGPVVAVMVSMRDGRGRARLDRDRSDLVATVAHELRSPLTGVKGFVQALLNRWDRLDDDQRKLMLRTVYADSERLSRLIAELLDVARLDTGRLSLYPRPVDALALCTRIVESIQVATSRVIEIRADEDLPEILADPDKFTQVLTNLVENGIRHGAGTVRVMLSADMDSDHVFIVVQDEGRGIPEELRRRVFTKFWTSGRSSGTGLGMYISHGLIRAHHGELEIQDAVGGGARLVMRWPIAHE